MLNFYYNCTSHQFIFTSLLSLDGDAERNARALSLARFPSPSLSDILINLVCWEDLNLYNVLLQALLRIAYF